MNDNENENDDQEEIHLDELLNEFLIRAAKAKQMAQAHLDDNSLLKRAIRWITTSKN